MHRAFGHHSATALARTGTDVDDVFGATDGVFVVLHHHQGVALLAQGVQRIEQQLVVTRVQADGGLVQYVAHALQVRAQLGRQANALRFATGQGGRGAIQAEVTQADLFHEAQAAFDFGDDVAGNGGFTAIELELLGPTLGFLHRVGGQLGNRQVAPRSSAAQLHGAGNRVQARTLAAGAGVVADVFHIGLGKGLFAATLFVGVGVVQHLALVAGQGQARAHAVFAPTMLAVVREQAWVQLGVAGTAGRAGALGGKHLDAAHVQGRLAFFQSLGQLVEWREQVHHAFAVFQRLGQQFAQAAFVFRGDQDIAHRQLDGVLAVAIDLRAFGGAPAGGRNEFAVDPQVRIALAGGPLGQLCVDALAVHDQGCQQANVLASVLAHPLGRNGFGCLG